jgi:hypothetical protein
MKLPKWLAELLDSLCAACVSEEKGRLSGFSCRCAKPRDNAWGMWLVQIAPAVLEIAGGRDDGTTGFAFLDVDLLALPLCLEEVESFAYDSDYGEVPRLRLVGQKRGRQVVVEIYFEPFEGDEPKTVFDVTLGGWRDKQADTD